MARRRASRRPRPTAQDSPRTLGEDRRKIHPKLRMVANGSTTVNSVRADQSSVLAVESPKLLAVLAEADLAPAKKADVRAKRGHLKAVSADVFASVFVQTNQSISPGRLPGQVTAARGNLFTARIPLSRLRSLAADETVSLVEPGEPLSVPKPIVATGSPAPPAVSLRRFGSASDHKNGRGVLIGIIDVQGFDFSHPDFLNDSGKTRFFRIWDQGGTGRASPAKYDYGAELTDEHLNTAIRASRSQSLPAYELEPQSEMVPGSHGTHVASIAAGNRGVCREAKIAGVLVSIPEEDNERRRSFYDSSRIVHAVEYLTALADKEGLQLSINVSLGTNGHAHDGSSAGSRWIDALLTVPGRAVTIAAGNAGQEAPEFEGDYGYVMGRIHTSGQVPASGLTVDIDWVVAGNGIVDVSENELEIWFGAQDRLAVSVRPPGGEWIGPIHPLEYIENQQLPGGSFLSIYNELYYPSNGSNYISIYLSPLLSTGGIVGIPAETWSVRLHGDEVRDGRYHAWIERDDPRPVGRSGERELWSFPSFFSARSNVDEASISSLACGHNVVAVANLDSVAERINRSSSEGPTRDGRYKPDCAAPGTEVVAARGFSEDDLWVAMTGTSMASPHVTGLIGLMLAVEPKLTASQIRGIIHRTARPLPGAGYQWQKGAGFGRLQEEDCLVEAAHINVRKDRTP